MSAAALTAQVQHHNQKGAFDICCSGRSVPCECSLLLSCRVWSSDGWTCCWREKCKGAKPISAPIFLCVFPLHSPVFFLYFPQCFSPAFAFLNERQKNNKTLGFSFVFELQKGEWKGTGGYERQGNKTGFKRKNGCFSPVKREFVNIQTWQIFSEITIREGDVKNVCLETRLKRCMSAWVTVRI